jgi:hypothetical protein
MDWRAILLYDFWFKFLGTSAFMAIFFWAYLFLLKNPAFPVTVVPLTVLDRWVPFSPVALIPYLSLWIYCSLPVMLMPSRARLLNFGWWIGVMCFSALAIYYWLPNAVPPAHVDWVLYPGMAFLKEVDAAGNACPSLHVAAAVYSSCWLFWLIQEMRWTSGAQAVQLLWGLAIVYSTIATKQHVALDAAAGILLAAVFAAASRMFDRQLRLPR